MEKKEEMLQFDTDDRKSEKDLKAKNKNLK